MLYPTNRLFWKLIYFPCLLILMRWMWRTLLYNCNNPPRSFLQSHHSLGPTSVNFFFSFSDLSWHLLGQYSKSMKICLEKHTVNMLLFFLFNNLENDKQVKLNQNFGWKKNIKLFDFLKHDIICVNSHGFLSELAI